jgi:hypothetical protein
MAGKGKVNIVGIVAWGLAGLLAVAAVGLGLWGGQQSGQAAALRAAVVQVAGTAGIQDVAVAAPAPEPAPAVEGEAPAEGETSAEPAVQELTADLLKTPDVLATVVERTTVAIQATQQELANTRDTLNSAEAQASSARNEVATLTQQVNEQTAQADSLSKELAAAGEALSKAQADLAKTAEEAQAAAEAADKQKARLEKTIDRLKTEKAEAVSRLEAEIEALKAPPPEELDEFGEEDAESSGEELPAEEPAEPEPVVEEGRVIGTSEMFSFIRYGEDQSLFFRLWDDQTLTYENVPPEMAARLAGSTDNLDVTYRFRIQGEFKSVPPDGVVVRKYWKWHRRHKARGDVRYDEPEAPAAEPADESGDAAAESAEETED